MSVNQHLSAFMNRCRVLAILLLLACALPTIGQTTQTTYTTYTYVKSKGKSQRDLQTAPSGQYQMQAVHEDRVVIYRQPSPNPFWLWRNAEAFITYVRWYDYTTDQSIPNIQLWKSRENSNKTDTIVQSDTLRTDNHGVMWYTSNKKGNPFQANAKYIYNPGSADKQVTYVACDQSFYTDWVDDSTNLTFTEPTLSQRMVFEIHPASEMAERVDSCAGSKWLEEYDIMAPTNQNIYLGPKYAFLNAEIKSGNTKGNYNNVVTSQTYPAYFYTIGNAVQSMASTNFANPTGSSSTIGTWQNVPNSTISDSSTIYICDSNYVINSTTWNLQASQFSNTDSDNDGIIEGDVIIDGLSWHYKRTFFKNENTGTQSTLVNPQDIVIDGVSYARFGEPNTNTAETLQLTPNIPTGACFESINITCFTDNVSNAYKIHLYVNGYLKKIDGKTSTTIASTPTSYSNSDALNGDTIKSILLSFTAKTSSCALYVKSIKLDIKNAPNSNALTGKVDSVSTSEPNPLVARFWRKIDTEKVYSDYTKTDVLTTGGSGWIWFEDGALPAKVPTATSGQYVNVGTQTAPTTKIYQLVYADGDGENTNTSTYTKTECTETETTYVYDNGTWVQSGRPNVQTYITKQEASSQDNSSHKIYKIAQFKVQYFDKNIVGPISQKMGDFVNNMELIAEQNFNFGYSETNKIPSGTSKQFWTTPLSTKESTYSFFYGPSTKEERALSISSRGYCHYNEYQFVNNGCGWGDKESDKSLNSQLANHVGNDKGVNQEAGFALYADGSQKAGTIFSIDFGAELCPGAKMYFTAWIGDLRRDASYTDGRPIFNFYVEGTDAQGNTKTLATFTTGEFANNGNFGWHYILFPLEFADDIDYEKFSFRIENMAATTANNDFFLDDVRVYLQRASITPIQASISNDPSCLVSNGTMMLYTRVDYGTDQIELEKTDKNTRSFYYRWYDKNGHPVDSADYYHKDNDAQGHAYGKVSIPIDTSNIQAADTSLNFQVFDKKANLEKDALFKFVKEQFLKTDFTVDTRYVVYVATPVPVHLGQSYRCFLSHAVSSLPVRPDSVTGEEKCTSDDIVSIVHGLCIRCEKLGGLVVDESQANANISYELSLVSESIKHGESITNKSVSCYYGFWLFGRDILDGEYNAQTKRQELEALYGASFGTVRDAIIAYIGNVSLNDGSVTCTQDQKNLVNRLVSIGALKLSNCSLKTDTSFLVLPLYTSDTISYTVFPVWDLGGKATQCHNPIDISLYFQNKSTPIEGDGGGEQTFIRNAISFVKSADEQLPTFMHNLRARRVRIPTDSIGKYVQIKMTDTSSKYTVKNATLIETTNTNTTAVEPLFKRTTSWVDTDLSVKNMTGEGPFRVHFKDLNLLPEGYSYTFRMDYDIRDINPATKRDTTYNGEAFITFMVVPEILIYNGSTSDAWNDDTKWQYRDQKNRKYVSAMAPLSYTKVVVEGYKLRVKPAVKPDEGQNALQILPVEQNAQPYITYDIGYEPFACSELFLFGNFQAVLGQHYLHSFDKNGNSIPPKWTFELWPNPNQWKLSSLPIKGVVLGDMFIPANYEKAEKDNASDLFTVRQISQTLGTAADDRTVFSFYNSMYNKSTSQYLGNNIYEDITTSTWTYATNALDRPLIAGFGWALGFINNSNVDQPKIRLPKKDTEYHYFRDETWIEESVQIQRIEELGDPMYELDENDQMIITLKNQEPSNVFLFGNPAFSAISLVNLKAKNPIIKGFYSGGIDINNRYVLAAGTDPNNTWYSNVSSSNKIPNDIVKTTEAIFIAINNTDTVVNIILDPTMLCNNGKNFNGYGEDFKKASAPAHPDLIEKEPSAIYISATLGDFMSSTSIIDAPDAELELFMLDREKTPYAIYTVGDNKAFTINHLREGQSRIPLAMYAEQPVEQPLFAFEGEPRDLLEWDIVDIKTGVRQPLYEGLTMRLYMPQDGSVRYYLERSRHGIYTSESKTEAFQTYAYGGMLNIYSEDNLYDLRIYDPAGRLLCIEADAGTSYTAYLTAGTYIIRASGTTCKVIVP